VQTAVVVGPPGEEIYTDKYGRVKVQFPWDREGKKDENTCCWVRVSQEWAGKGWGGMQIPHVGHEVIVAFLEGDPDRPLIVGRVYNAEQSAPMPLPAEKTRSVLRDYGGNETVMEGAKGKQFIHTQQTCGNEFLMDGSGGNEKIALKDKFGNQIVLDAVEKIIRIFCPSHESEIVLGRSIFWTTLSNMWQDIKGDVIKDYKGSEWTKIGGPKHENIAGLSSKLIGGVKHETVIGLEAKVNLGLKLEYVVALACKIVRGKKFEKDYAGVWGKAKSKSETLDEEYSLKAGTKATLAAKTAIWVHGGESALLSSPKSAIVSSKNVYISATSQLEILAPNVVIAGNLKVTGKLEYQHGNLKVIGSPSKSPKKGKTPKKEPSPAVKEARRAKAAAKAAKKTLAKLAAKYGKV